jgi:hypothetical protein
MELQCKEYSERQNLNESIKFQKYKYDKSLFTLFLFRSFFAFLKIIIVEQSTTAEFPDLQNV